MKLTHVEGAVLAGGASLRMGRAKAGLAYAGRPMVERVASALAACVEPVRLVLRPGDLSPLDLPVVRDRHAARAALVGVAAALAACEAPAVLIAACDQPELDPRVLLLLCAACPALTGPDVIAFETPRGPAPFPAIYRRTLLDRVEERIARGELAMHALLERCALRTIPRATLLSLDPDGRSLLNVNTPEDLL